MICLFKVNFKTLGLGVSNQKKIRIFYSLIFFVLVSCDSSKIPKQNAFFAPQFKLPTYNLTATDCNYVFSKNKIARIEYIDNCNFNIIYDNLNAKIFFSSINLNNNFPEIIKIFDERIIENSSSASHVKVSEYEDSKISVYSRMFNYVGNTPSNVQFYLTDSISNFLAGSLFFNIEPNYDSLLPYINYIKTDIRKLIENFQWNK